MLDAKTANFSQVPYKDEITDTSSGTIKLNKDQFMGKMDYITIM